MDHLFDEMIDTLAEARDAVREEVEAHTRRSVPDGDALWQLSQSIRSFAQQTDSLLLMMVERDAPEPLLERVEDLFDYFREVEDRIKRLLAANRVRVQGRA